MSLLYCRFKRGQIDLAEGAFIDNGIDVCTVCFLIVADKMLGARPYALLLDLLDDFRYQFATQKRIFTCRIFEISPSKWRAIKVHSGTQDREKSAGPRIPAQTSSQVSGAIRVPCGGKHRSPRIANAGRGYPHP